MVGKSFKRSAKNKPSGRKHYDRIPDRKKDLREQRKIDRLFKYLSRFPVQAEL
jgi:hypothetical protein